MPKIKALHHSASKGNFGMVSELLEHIPIDSKEVQFGWTPLHLAARNGELKTILLLIYSGAKLEERDIHKETALHIACFKGNLAAVELLLRMGAKRKKNLDGEVASEVSEKYGHFACAELVRKFWRKSKREKMEAVER